VNSLAFFSMFHPKRGGMADYSDDLVAALSRHFAITCYVDGDYEPEHVGDHATVARHTDFRGREDFTVYQIGNSLELSFLVPMLVRHGGTVTLHDACQLDVTYPYFKKRRWRFALEAMRSLDREARRVLLRSVGLSWNPAKMVDAAMAAYESHPEKRRLFPFTRFILRHADHVILHSRYLEEHVRGLLPGLPTSIIPLGAHPVSIEPRADSRRRVKERFDLPIEPDTPVFLSFGAIQLHKRIRPVLQALGSFVSERPDALYLLVGPRDSEYDLDGDIRAFGVGDHVRVLDSYLPMAEVNDCINAADLCFNLRWPSLGSTSSTLHKIFAVGRPAAVTAAESLQEYPESFTFAVPPPGDAEWQRCLEIMRIAREDPERLEAMGAAARRFIEEECAWDRVAERYAEVIRRG
jgi:glycosyltransferase involved in cell wall biosynthesis